MSSPAYAFVTLLTTSSYLPGALVLAHSLRDLHPAPRTIEFQTVCLVTPETVDVGTIKRLRAVYDLVIGVEVIGSQGDEGLRLMGRPDLSTALTKLHIFRLGDLFTKIIYLDADVLPLRPLSQLFQLPNKISAVPDSGWPDSFNSGVIVVTPSHSDFEGMSKLMASAHAAGKDASWDSADQGLLNEWFSEEGGGGDWNRLSFTYNVTPTAAYTYAPAYKRFGSKIHAIHFIGSGKPWKSIMTRPARAPTPNLANQPFDYPALIDRWFAVYDKYERPLGAPVLDLNKAFQVPHTAAVWDQPALATDQGRMDLEQLKHAAEKGVSYYLEGPSMIEGRYISLPLEGRVDLMRPPPVVPSLKSEETLDRAPSPGGVADSPPIYAQHLVEESSKPSDMVAWDAQRSSPPINSGPEMKDGMNEFYENAWDKPIEQAMADPWNANAGYPVIPDEVRYNDWYAGAADVAPDTRKVGHVFPWEEEQRPKPSRRFPDEQSEEKPVEEPPVAIQVQQATPVSSPPEPSSPAPPAPRVLSMSEAMQSYKNAWDDIPSIQLYASRLASPRRISQEAVSKDAGSGSTTPTRDNPEGKKVRTRKDSDGNASEGSHFGDDEETDSTDQESPSEVVAAAVAAVKGGDYISSGGGAGAGRKASGSGSSGFTSPRHGKKSTDTLKKTAGYQSKNGGNRSSDSGSSTAVAAPKSAIGLTKLTSSETTPTPSSASSPSTGENVRVAKEPSQAAPVGRVFDPSTSVDARRRDTVEVLTRLMRQTTAPSATTS